MKYWLCLAIFFTLIPASSAVVRKKPAASKTSAKKKTVAKTSSPGKRGRSKTIPAKRSRGRRSTFSRLTSPAAAKQPPRQLTPSNDRYQEIQQALAAKGYLTTPPNGQWDQNSQDAMRRFQTDQNLNSNGKLTSRSIIALGLGSQSTPPKP